MDYTNLNSVNSENTLSLQKSGILAIQEPMNKNLMQNLSSNENAEISDDTKGEYLDLYQKQNETSKELEQRAEENNIRDIDGSKMYFNPDRLKFDDDMIIYSTGMPSAPAHLFQKTESSFKEIPVLPEKIHYDGENGVLCRNIRIVENGVYSIELVHMKNRSVENNEVYYIDKLGKILNQVGKLGTYLDDRGISHERHERKNSRGFRELQEEYEGNKNIKSKLTIFDKKFNVLFTIENSQQYQVQYCDEEICICQDTKEYFPKKYIIVDKTGIIAQGTADELKSNEHMQKFLEKEEIRQKKRKENEDKEREKRSLPFGERFKEINHCVLSLNEKGDIATIQNDEGKTIYEIKDILDFYENDYRPEFRTRDGNLKIAERNKDSNILLVQKHEGGYHKKSIFINKTTGEKLEFGIYSFLHEKLIEVFVNGNDSEIYDENLNKLGTRIWSGSGLYAVARQENGEIKTYLYNSNTGEQLCEIENGRSNKTIKRFYSGDDGKDHLIIEKKDGTLIEVSP